MNKLTAPAPYEYSEKPVHPEGLNDRQAKFCREYVVDMNGFRAAVRAGYSEASAIAIASQNLSKPHIKKHIEALQEVALDEMGATRYRVLQEISRLAFSDIRNVIDENGNVISPNDWDDDTAAAISSLEISSIGNGDGELITTRKIKTWDKTRALEQLSRCLGIGKGDGPTVAVQINIAKEDAAGF